MKNVLDRLTELAKDNPSPDVKQAMENTRRMSVVEDADVVEVHEGAIDNDDEMTEDVRGLYYGDKGIRPPQTQAERDQIAGDIKQARTTNRADQTTTGYGDRVAPQLGAASSATPGQIGAKTTNAAGQTAFSTRSADPKYANYAGNIKTAAGAGKGVAEGGKTPKQYWNRDSQSIGSTPDDGLTYADPDEDGVHYPDYGNTKFQQQAKPKPTQATSANKRLTDKQYAKQLHKHYASLYDTLRITFNRRKNIFSVTGNNGFETDYHKYRVDPTTNKLKIMMSTSVENESVNPGIAEGHFSDQDVQKKDKQYAGTKAYHAKKKAEKEKTATDAKTAFDTKFGGGNPASALKIREQSVTEGVNFAEMHRDKHTTLDEMLNELHDDINTFKQCGQMSEQLRDFMEVHHYGKKQLMDAAYGPVDELADMTKLAGVPGPIGQPDEELAESSGEMINGKEVDMYSLEVGGVDYQDSPDFVDAYFEAGSFVDGTPLSDNELEQLTHERGDLVSELASEHMIGAGDDARDRQRDLDMELEGVNDGDNGLASAHAKARQISGEHGVGQHVNRDPESGYHRASDWYVDGETVGSYNMGKRYDDSGYIDEEEMIPGEESDVAQKAQGIEAVSGKKINQMNPGEIKMAGQKVDAMGVTESKQMVDECGMMGDSMQPNTPANINISASAASGGEVAAMINDLLKLAGRPENADAHMDEPGVVAIDGTMDAGGAEELAAMLGGEEVVDETGDAGGFADATTQPDALVYDQNPVLTQTGVQKHTLGGYHNGDSPLAATTELEESLWRKFQNQ